MNVNRTLMTSNISLQTDSQKRQLYRSFYLYFLVLDSVLILPTVLGNSLLAVAIGKFRSLRKSRAYMLIGNLAVSDLLVGLVQVPMDIVAMQWDWASGDKTFCLWHHCLGNAFLGASVMNLLLMSVERFHAIRYPLKHKATFTRKRLLILIVLSWIFITLLSFVPFFGWYDDREDSDFVCKTDDLFTLGYRRLFNSVMVTSLVTNFVLFLVVVEITISNRGSFEKRNRGVQRRTNLHFNHTKLMLLVSGIFAICWGPYCVFSLIYLYSETMTFVRCVLSSLGLINSGLNWIIYGLRNVKIRKSLKLLLTCNYDDKLFRASYSGRRSLRLELTG